MMLMTGGRVHAAAPRGTIKQSASPARETICLIVIPPSFLKLSSRITLSGEVAVFGRGKRFRRRGTFSDEGRVSEEEAVYQRRGRFLEDGEVVSEEGAVSEEGEVFGRGLRAGLRDDGLQDDASGRLFGGVACDRHMREPPCGVVMCDCQPWAPACGVMLRGHHLCARVGATWCVNTCWHASGVAVRDMRARRAGACVRSGVVRPPCVRACMVMVHTQEARMGACHRGC